jgi:hypothetical protein
MMLPEVREIKNQQQIQLKLSTIFKQELVDTPQAFGSFYDENGKKYCALSVLARFLGYDIATSKKIRGENPNVSAEESIPGDILETIENFGLSCNPDASLPSCFCCSKPNYYYRSLITLLVHLNDYHTMTFREIGNWLESKDM